MYFKFSLRYNKDQQRSDAYYRLVESYRSVDGRVSHRTILNIGFLEGRYTPEQLNFPPLVVFFTTNTRAGQTTMVTTVISPSG